VDGPFVEEKNHIAGFWLIRVNSLNEAIEWAKRIPVVRGEVEVRQTALQLLALQQRVAVADRGSSGMMEAQQKR
jgi:hypothetical protein